MTVSDRRRRDNSFFQSYWGQTEAMLSEFLLAALSIKKHHELRNMCFPRWSLFPFKLEQVFFSPPTVKSIPNDTLFHSYPRRHHSSSEPLNEIQLLNCYHHLPPDTHAVRPPGCPIFSFCKAENSKFCNSASADSKPLSRLRPASPDSNPPAFAKKRSHYAKEKCPLLKKSPRS